MARRFGEDGAQTSLAPPSQPEKPDPMQAPVNGVTAKLEQVAKMLAQTCTGSEAATVGATGCPDLRSENDSHMKQTQGQAQARLKQLETFKAQLPESDGFRIQIDEEIVAVKKLIANSKPLGSRIESAKHAKERAEKRLHQSKLAEQLAATATADAQAELDKISRDIAALEAELLASAPSVAHSSAGPVTIDTLRGNLECVLGAMATFPSALPSHAAEARELMGRLLSGLSAMEANAQALNACRDGAGCPATHTACTQGACTGFPMAPAQQWPQQVMLTPAASQPVPATPAPICPQQAGPPMMNSAPPVPSVMLQLQHGVNAQNVLAQQMRHFQMQQAMLMQQQPLPRNLESEMESSGFGSTRSRTPPG